MNDLADSTTITKIIPITNISADVCSNFDKVVTISVMTKLIATTDSAPNNKLTFKFSLNSENVCCVFNFYFLF